jgi:hypothetical protein
MGHVSFEDCEMVSVIFSDNSGLSTVIIDPKKHIKFTIGAIGPSRLNPGARDGH